MTDTLNLIASIHAMIGYCGSFKPGDTVTQAYIDRLNEHYIPNLINAMEAMSPEREYASFSEACAAQQEGIEAQNQDAKDGWIEHTGDKCPLEDESLLVEVRLKQNATSSHGTVGAAGTYWWGQDCRFPVYQYRVVLPQIEDGASE